MCEVLQEALIVGEDEKSYDNTKVCARGGNNINEPAVVEKSYG